MSENEIRVQIPGDTLPTSIVFELPDGEQWGTASGTFNHYEGRGTYQLRQLPNRRDEVRQELTDAANDHREAEKAVTESLEHYEVTHLRLMAAARAVLEYSQKQRGAE